MRYAAVLLAISFLNLPGQVRKVDLRHTYERLICVVPIVGAGTPADPKRPEYAPLPTPGGPAADGIIAFNYVPSDDGKFALVEFVARDRSAFKAILADKRPEVRAFEKRKTKREDIEKELRRHRRNIDLDSLGVMVP